jgi:hypothetical protein
MLYTVPPLVIAAVTLSMHTGSTGVGDICHWYQCIGHFTWGTHGCKSIMYCMVVHVMAAVPDLHCKLCQLSK